MADQTQICNMALTKIGQSTISAITDDTPTANALRTIYNQVLDEALTAGPEKGWKFTKPETDYDISVDATSPGDEYEYRYSLPDNCLRIIRVHVEGTEVTDWERKGQYIMTNQEDSEITLDYVRRITTTGLFPPHFVKVLYTMIAYHLAFKIVKNQNLANAVFQELEMKVLPRAIAMDEQDQYVQEESSAWVDIGRSTTTIE